MRIAALLALAAWGAGLLAGCALPGGVNLRQVASESRLNTITTGDGAFGTYKTTGHYRATEIGLGIGIPFLAKFVEIPPNFSDEELVGIIASDASAAGATSMINLQPPKSFFTGFPFILVGLYVDRTEGTGIQ